jgi:hypothetical protein
LNDYGDLTDYEIAWALLSTILRGHDPAGVSLGRSRRNFILKHIIHLLPDPQIEMDELERDGAGLFQEARLRVKIREQLQSEQQMLLPFSLVPEFLDGEILATILLERLRQWYEDDEKRNSIGYISETSLLEPAMAIIGLNDGIYFDPKLWQIDTDEILRESRNRDWRKYENDDLTYYWNCRSTI